MSSVARMRTINESLQLIKELDSQSAITYNFIRNLVKGNQIRSFQSGKRTIINYDDLLKIINNGIGEE